MTMDELIARLEAASGPDSAADKAIARFMVATAGWIEHPWSGFRGMFFTNERDEDQCRLGEEAPRFTSSLDAALSLVPEGYAIERLGIWPGHPATVTVLATYKGQDGMYWHDLGKNGRFEAEAATPALALVIASLKARARAAP